MWFLRRRRPKTRRARYQDNNPLKKQILVGVVLVVLVSGIVAGVWYGSRIAALQLSTVTIIGGPTIPHEEVEAIVWQQLAGSYFALVPRQFYYTYPEEAVLAAVRSIERVKAATVVVADRSELIVAFEEYIPDSLWCSQVSADARDCVFLDAAGYAFSPAPVLQGGAFVRYVYTGRVPAVGETPFTSEFLQETNTFSQWLTETFGWYVTHIVYDNGIDVEYELAAGGSLKVTTQIPLTTTQANLETLLASPEMEKERAGDFEYIDLRFGDKIFIRDVELEPVATSTEAVATTSEEFILGATSTEIAN